MPSPASACLVHAQPAPIGPDSDIDVVLHGQVTQERVDRLWTLFDASPLPLKVDLVAYELIDYPPLREQIDAVEKTLFTKENLAGMVSEGGIGVAMERKLPSTESVKQG